MIPAHSTEELGEDTSVSMLPNMAPEALQQNILPVPQLPLDEEEEEVPPPDPQDNAHEEQRQSESDPGETLQEDAPGSLDDQLGEIPTEQGGQEGRPDDMAEQLDCVSYPNDRFVVYGCINSLKQEHKCVYVECHTCYIEQAPQKRKRRGRATDSTECSHTHESLEILDDGSYFKAGHRAIHRAMCKDEGLSYRLPSHCARCLLSIDWPIPNKARETDDC